MHSPMLMEYLFLFSFFFCPCSSYINSKYTLQLQCTPRPVQLHVCSSIGEGVEGGIVFHCCTFSTDMCRYNN